MSELTAADLLDTCPMCQAWASPGSIVDEARLLRAHEMESLPATSPVGSEPLGLDIPAIMARVERTQHRTLTAERPAGERYVTRSNGSRGQYRPERQTIWACTCGSGGFGRNNDRADARALARWHRKDPTGFPGHPGITLSGLLVEAGGEG